jgi:hypothetical protein
MLSIEDYLRARRARPISTSEKVGAMSLLAILGVAAYVGVSRIPSFGTANQDIQKIDRQLHREAVKVGTFILGAAGKEPSDFGEPLPAGNGLTDVSFLKIINGQAYTFSADMKTKGHQLQPASTSSAEIWEQPGDSTGGEHLTFSRHDWSNGTTVWSASETGQGPKQVVNEGGIIDRGNSADTSQIVHDAEVLLAEARKAIQ